MSRKRRIRAGLVVARSATVLAACADIPESGSVVRAGGELESEEEAIQIEPPGPIPKGTPVEIVTGFVEAMQASPPTTEFAKEFLTKDAAVAWDPFRETVVYEGFEPTPVDQSVDLQVRRQATLSKGGVYRPVDPSEASEVHRYQLRREDGEWRIANPPNAFYVDDLTFTGNYLPYSLYFVAPFGDDLVPYPIYLPNGDQLATSLVKGVLAGPPGRAGQPALTAVPPNTTVDVSASVQPDGIAEIRLNDPLLGLSDKLRGLLSAQLVMTISQVPGVEGVRILVDGALWDIPGAPPVQNVGLYTSKDPAQEPGRKEFYALDDGRLVRIGDPSDADSTLAGGLSVRRMTRSQWGSQARGIRSFDVALDLSRLLGVTTDGRGLLTGKLFNSKGDTPREIYDGGTDLAQPVAMANGDWLVVDRRPDGSHLLVVSGGDVRELPSGLLRRERIRSLSLSPDGTR